MSHENAADPSAALQASRTKSKCIELLALAADYREVLPQVLELLRQYYAAEQVQFCECGDADAGKPDSIGRLAESEKTNVGGAGNFAASVIFEEKLYGKLLVVHGSAAASDRTLLSDIGRVLASEIWKKTVSGVSASFKLSGPADRDSEQYILYLDAESSAGASGSCGRCFCGFKRAEILKRYLRTRIWGSGHPASGRGMYGVFCKRPALPDRRR